MKIDAILSDYDGTLCPTSSISQDNSNSSIIPKRLETIIWNISEKIDICIVSSKDFGFLHRRTKFAKILSCIMGIETLVLKRHKLKAVMRENQYQYDSSNNNINNKTNTSFGECKDKLQCILSSHIPSNKDILQDNSRLLDSLADEISINFKNITVERKFTSDNQILAGITIDYRHLKDWQSYKRNIEPHLEEIFQRNINSSSANQHYYIQTYSTHPFMDIYSVRCNKGLAFDATISALSSFNADDGIRQNILYLGDSENDNPAFKRADVSIGVCSDKRLNPELTCQYLVEFDQLSIFLKRLQYNDFVFSDKLLLNL
ncbi:MAG TPA: HAD-IIB family hydrolase [Nitrososphaeraceae archaeon]|nr:HAD-IIB family hydrolase [Nitrososphaeraceae archaeon]